MTPSAVLERSSEHTDARLLRQTRKHRLALKALLWIILSGGSFFSVANLLHDNRLLVALEIGYAAASL